MFDPYEKAKQVDRLIYKLLEDDPPTESSSDEHIRRWMIYVRTIRSGCDIITESCKKELERRKRR